MTGPIGVGVELGKELSRRERGRMIVVSQIVAMIVQDIVVSVVVHVVGWINAVIVR